MGNYLQGEESLPFEVRTEELLILDRESGGYRSETMSIRSTSRGAIISDHGLGPVEGQLLSLRWSVPEYAGPDSGNRELLLATNMEEALAAIGKTTTPLSYIVVDKAGDIARVASGVVPLRASGEGLVPMPAPAEDNWLGRIPPEEMPRQLNPEKAWVGTTNHRVTEADYPYPYSTHFAGSWRYWRLMELMEEGTISADDHWAANLDVKNLLAQRMRPAMLEAFAAAPKLKPLAELLESWDLYDTVDQAAPLVFQSVFRHFAEQVFVDEMGEDLLMAYLKEPYYWQEKLLAMYERNDSAWFDDVRTDEVEGRRELLLRAGRLALAELSADWGDNPANWRWGDAHTVTFAHPFIPGDRAANWIGGGTHAMAGSGETLNRAIWMWDKPYQTRIIDSIRIIVDMADDDKIEAHFPGGTSERWFDSWNKNFLPYWLSGEKAYWYFSDRAIEDNARYELLLKP